MCKHGSAGHVLENVEECGRSPNQKRLYALMLHDLPISPLLPSPPLSPPLSPPPSLPSPFSLLSPPLSSLLPSPLSSPLLSPPLSPPLLSRLYKPIISLPNQKRLYALMLHDLPTSPLLPSLPPSLPALPPCPHLSSPPLPSPLSSPLPSPSIPSLQTNLLLTLEVFPTDEAGVDIVVGEGDGTKLLKVKVKN